MKFRCDRDDLSEALQTVQRGVSSRPGIPALTGVLIEATDAGALTLTTTDLDGLQTAAERLAETTFDKPLEPALEPL